MKNIMFLFLKPNRITLVFKSTVSKIRVFSNLNPCSNGTRTWIFVHLKMGLNE